MPELPEVETMRLGIAPILGGRVRAARRAPCKKRPIVIEPRIDWLHKRIQGETIVATDRIGKRLILVFSNQERLVMEPRMSGLILIDEPPTREHLRFVLELEKANVDRLMFWDRRGLGQIRLFRPDEFQRELLDGKIGPDALRIEAHQLREGLAKSGREIKVGLLDQSQIAGIGNIYASEILFLSGVHPQARCNRLKKEQWRRIHRWTRKVMENAIRHEGSTLSDGTYRTAQNDPGRYQNQHHVYDRAGDTCGRCRQASIKRIVQAQRSTFFCPRCQTKTDRPASR